MDALGNRGLAIFSIRQLNYLGMAFVAYRDGKGLAFSPVLVCRYGKNLSGYNRLKIVLLSGNSQNGKYKDCYRPKSNGKRNGEQ